MGLFDRYEQVPGGQNAGPLAGSGSSRMERRQLRRGVIISAFFTSLTLLLLGLAFSRNPHWWEPVGYFDTSQSEKTAIRDAGDTLPAIDWSWKGDSSKSSWWTSSAGPKLGSKAWLDRYPGFVHGPAPRQVSR